ncbi:hypothetical protein RVR_4435 [Actinacidiphila reveromycinica]|uniref:Uncharacterized protein n=1 Tax=Actinacidiphila reveromycinica TaxID=659352 RepID=A0A7U3UT51_9ACTN|nr:hypothetical protein [Streptomyces sp. SN-593]BBA98302.1 hypothetical protein RVR_4435 [Streptomyces sp. SN-593]
MSDGTKGPGDEEVKQVVNAVKDAVDSLEALSDEPERQALGAGMLLAAWPDQQKRLRQLRQDAVRKLRAEKVSYRKIAAMLRISVARVQQIEAGETGRDGRAKGDPPTTA